MKIVVIEACGLHLGYLGCYGNDWAATPNLDRLATEGVVFDWHYVDQPELQPRAPWPQRSVATGRYALPGDPVVELSTGVPVPRVVRCESAEYFAAQALKALHANVPWLWIEGPSLLPPWNFDDDLLTAYFDEDDEQEGLVAWKDPPLDLVTLTEAELLELQNTYAAVMTFFDAQLGAVLDSLRENGLLDDLLLCVTARSGLPLGEHGMIGAPQPCVNDELVHVPLLLRLPRAAEAGVRVAALTQPVDLLPTFLQALSAESSLASAADHLHGHSLWPLIRGEVEQVRPCAVSAMRIGTRENRLLRTWEWALHVTSAAAAGLDAPAAAPRLFAKPEDRWEVNDLYQQQIELGEDLERQLHSFALALRQPGALVYGP